MILVNQSERLICIGTVRIAPLEAREIAESFSDNAVVKSYINNGVLALSEQTAAEVIEESEDVSVDFESMKVADLKIYAESKGISIKGAKNRSEIIALLKA